MSSDLTLDFEDHQHHPMMMNSDTGNMSIDQDGEWGKPCFNVIRTGVFFYTCQDCKLCNTPYDHKCKATSVLSDLNN